MDRSTLIGDNLTWVCGFFLGKQGPVFVVPLVASSIGLIRDGGAGFNMRVCIA